MLGYEVGSSKHLWRKTRGYETKWASEDTVKYSQASHPSRKIRLNSDYYIANILDKLVKPAFQGNVTDGNIAQVRLFNDNDLGIFQQDGARCHTSAKTTNWLDDNIPLYIKPKDWPPLSRPFSYWQSVEYPITKCLPRSGADKCCAAETSPTTSLEISGSWNASDINRIYAGQNTRCH